MPENAELPGSCAALVDAVGRRDAAGFREVYEVLVERLPEADGAQLSAALAVLGPALPDLSLGNGGDLVQLTGALVHLGGDPAPVLGPLVLRVADALERATRFVGRWRAAGGGEPPAPERDNIPAVLTRLPTPDGRHVAEAWFAVDEWVAGLLVPLQLADVRRALPHRDRLRAATGAARRVASAPWLHGLLDVLDDEPLVVVHRGTGAAYELTVGGVGDNAQLHTLLAAVLVGDPARGLLPGRPPHPRWVAAAVDGDDLRPEGGIRGSFTLVDAHGAAIRHEGRPADVPLVGGRRVVVLDPPRGRSWEAGRAYPLMRPTVVLDRVLTGADAARWADLVAPGRR
ncbi:hypothetical protein [Saccharothrix sp. Mg75]|uniref:hypothetical protein n=1 Tax=Saccharothrix sp. Mg75 TaxID=3445357 RepID=UPI003EEF9C14